MIFPISFMTANTVNSCGNVLVSRVAGGCKICVFGSLSLMQRVLVETLELDYKL
jgi:hypothetical protein